ncbi:beta-1,3-N-acetylglucosaminyltransferase radical fringe [Spea bombifrons]|uniref:beta-1,3-N-acetylglucosaminyltransferase radical fringe n=1 Tax=Spea bombifrons TaxID=233779 RepID=UPI00234A7DB2|nr:beta-1,3-N-acetylglucosaminyltransferase radical fringe [Spea bombifrons]XP_053309264.1 beta-1,3-N-acetylglucosaminyltransferase radical fringe [Spea bombifrons]
MKVSCLEFSKICFVLSVCLCAALLLLIPWRQRDLSQPHPVLTCTNTYLETPAEPARFTAPLRWEEWESPGAGVKAAATAEDRQLAKKPLRVEDLFIAVKTTKKYHKSRLSLLMQTWISRAKLQTFIFTDWEDQELRQEAGDQMVNTNCSSVHTRQALCCKMAVEYDKFVLSGKKWFCHVDDDNYVNVRALVDLLSALSPSRDVYVGRPSLNHPVETPDRVKGDGSVTLKFWFATGGAGFCISRGLALKMSPWASMGNFISTAEKVRLPDDCTIGYIIEGLLEVKMQHSNLFHSHLENLERLSPDSLLQQVTLSYGGPENQRNVVRVSGPFSVKEDPTRFKSVHCLLYPDTSWCPDRRSTSR